MFHLDPAPDLTPSPRVLMLPPRDMPPTTDTMARGLLMPRLTPVSSMELMAMLVCPMLDMLPMELTPTPMEPTPTCMVSPLDPALVLTPSPRALMLPPRDMPPTPTDTDSPDMPMESKSSLRRDQQPNKLLFMIAATDNCNIQ